MQLYNQRWPALLFAVGLAACGSATPMAPEGTSTSSASITLPTASVPVEAAPTSGSVEPHATATAQARRASQNDAGAPQPASPTNLSLGPGAATPEDESSETTLVATRAPISALPPESLAPTPAAIAGGDSDQTIELVAGQTFRLKTVNRSGWVVKVGDEHIIAPIPADSATSPIEFKALSPGTTAIVATRQGCGSRKPGCRQLAITLHMTIIVHPPNAG